MLSSHTRNAAARFKIIHAEGSDTVLLRLVLTICYTFVDAITYVDNLG